MPVYPCLVESVFNHAGVVIKCYAMKGQLFLVAKPSLPDAPDPGRDAATAYTSGGGGCQRFHSLTDMPCAAAEDIDTGVSESVQVQEAAEACARVIAETTQLALFGFDLVQPTARSHLVLVDVNAFPSFRGVPGAAGAWRAIVNSIVQGTDRQV